MKGLSVLFTLALFIGAHVLAVQLRRARALPVQQPAHRRVTQTAFAHRAGRPPAPPAPAATSFEFLIPAS